MYIPSSSEFLKPRETPIQSFEDPIEAVEKVIKDGECWRTFTELVKIVHDAGYFTRENHLDELGIDHFTLNRFLEACEKKSGPIQWWVDCNGLLYFGLKIQDLKTSEIYTGYFANIVQLDTPFTRTHAPTMKNNLRALLRKEIVIIRPEHPYTNGYLPEYHCKLADCD